MTCISTFFSIVNQNLSGFFRGGTRMAGLLTACCDASKVIVPMLGTIIQCKIREEEAAYLSTVVGKSYSIKEKRNMNILQHQINLCSFIYSKPSYFQGCISFNYLRTSTTYLQTNTYMLWTLTTYWYQKFSTKPTKLHRTWNLWEHLKPTVYYST